MFLGDGMEQILLAISAMFEGVTVRAEEFQVREVIICAVLVFVMGLEYLRKLFVSAVRTYQGSARFDEALPLARFSSGHFSMALKRTILKPLCIQFRDRHFSSTGDARDLGLLRKQKPHLASVGAESKSSSCGSISLKFIPAKFAGVSGNMRDFSWDYTVFYVPNAATPARAKTRLRSFIP
jgi:hypothetical protein